MKYGEGVGQRRFLSAIFVVVMSCVTPGCASSNSIPLDVAEHGEAVRLGQFGLQELLGEVKDGRACFWGRIEGREIALVWPLGSVAKADPLE